MRALAASFVLCLAGCTHVFFQPSNVIYSTPGLFGMDYQPVELRAADGTELFAWFFPARGPARATVLYLHGNAENISSHFPNVAWLPASGFNVLDAKALLLVAPPAQMKELDLRAADVARVVVEDVVIGRSHAELEESAAAAAPRTRGEARGGVAVIGPHAGLDPRRL